MKKSFVMTIMMALLLIAVLVMPISAKQVGTVISQGATVFIGEEGLDVSPALNVSGEYYDQIGWWASGSDIKTTSPTKTINMNGRNPFTVSSSDFVGSTGNWYGLNSTYNSRWGVVFYVADPQIDVTVWDSKIGESVNGKSVVMGEPLTFKINTNMYTVAQATRKNAGTHTDPVTVVSPIANFTVSGKALAVVFTDASTSSVVPNTYTWTIDGVVVNEKDPVMVLSSGVHNVKLAVNNTAYDESIVTDKKSELNAIVTVSATSAVISSYVSSTAPVPVSKMIGGSSGVTTPVVAENGKDGFIDIKVKSASGSTFTTLKGKVPFELTNIFPDTTPKLLDGLWQTNFTDTDGNRAYPQGTYTVTAESTLNNMKSNYRNGGADYTGKTVSAVSTVTIVSDSIKIVSNVDSVVRGKTFSVTITGSPKTDYYVWTKGTSTMLGNTTDEQPPMVRTGQEDVYVGDIAAGNHPYENGAGKLVKQDVPQYINSSKHYAKVVTAASGARTIEFSTSNFTKAQKYTIRVEGTDTENYKTDEVSVKVEAGGVSIIAAGDQNYYLGEEIKFSGTNTESYNTYLFIIGPNLPASGASIKEMNPRDPTKKVVNGDKTNFKTVEVNGDNTWSWKWGTAAVALDAGTYTIYAVSQPSDRDNLQNVAYGTVSIIIKKPFVSATATQPIIAKGDRLFITGTAEGNPSQGVAVWILGKNYATRKTESVSADSSFKYEITQGDTKMLASGQYFIVVQHPMQNNQFDIIQKGNNVVNLQLGAAGTSVFQMLGGGSLQGSDAAEALVQAINDPNVDDTYTKLQVLVEEPVIRIDPIGDKRVGDKFTVTGRTNLAIDDEVLVEIYSSSFKPTQKTQSGEFSGTTGAVKVAKGDDGLNEISIDVDSSTFKSDEYIVTAKAIIQDATGTALFSVTDAPVATPVVTSVVTMSTPIPIAPTAAPTVAVTTVIPTTTKSPGYGALVALVGLGMVAFIVVRRE